MCPVLVKFQAGVVYVVEAGLETSVDTACLLTEPAICEDCQSAGVWKIHEGA